MTETLSNWLAGNGRLAVATATHVVSRLSDQVQSLHESGRIHAQISTDHVVVVDESRPAVVLADSAGQVSLGGSNLVEDQCPPELRNGTEFRISTVIEEASEGFAQNGVSIRPQRIDVYQLGALLCRLITGGSVRRFLSSPRVKREVAPPLQHLIERVTGSNGAQWYPDVKRFADALSDAVRELENSSAATTSTAEPPFQVLGHYRILERIGRGGMGDVYRGYEEVLDRHVAIKVLSGDLAHREDFVRRFRDEATSAARLVHANVVQIFFIGEDCGRHFFSMQFVDGESLDDLLRRRGS